MAHFAVWVRFTNPKLKLAARREFLTYTVECDSAEEAIAEVRACGFCFGLNASFVSLRACAVAVPPAVLTDTAER
jgi:hypothetical protein